jgi:hypothetical protein
MVHAEVWPAAISPSPVNPRAAGDRVFPAGMSSDPRVAVARKPLVSASSDPNGLPLVTLEVDDQDHLVESLQDSMDVLMSTAQKLLVDIPEQGIMRPVTVMAMRVSHADGSPDVTVPTTPDGSSRTTIAWQKWGLANAAEVYSVIDDRRLGARIAAVERLAGQDASLLAEEDRVLLRLATMPAMVVVGYEPDLASSVTFAEAVEAWVSMIHVDPPRPWGPAADLDTKATAILGSFRRQAGWSTNYIDYLGGNLTPAAAVAAGFGPTPDARALEIIACMGDDNLKTILNDGLRRLGARKPHRPERLEPLVELMLRPLRGPAATPSEIGVARTILSNLRGMAEWNRPGWRPSRLSLQSLYEAAVAELCDAEAAAEDYEDAPPAGVHAVELAFMGAFWLARYSGLRRQTRGASSDDREPEHLLRALMASNYGLAVLRRIVHDGRAGRRPRAISSAGTELVDATGDELFVTTTWLKSAFPVQGVATVSPPTGPDFTKAVRTVREHVDTLESAVRDLMAIRGPSGDKIARKLGIKTGPVEDMKRKLNYVSDQLGLCAIVWEDRHTGDGEADEHLGDDDADLAQDVE